LDPKKPTIFNQVIGADGIGATVSKGTAGEFYWASIENGYMYCNPAFSTCDQGGTWSQIDPSISVDDTKPFFVRYSRIPTDPTGISVLTNTDHAVYKSTAAPDWVKLGPTYPADRYVRAVFASPTIPKLYGAMLNAGLYAITTDENNWY